MDQAVRGAEFRTDDQRRRGLPADVVRRLNTLDDRQALRSVAETLGVIAAAVAAALMWWHPAVVALAVVLIATRQQACFVLAHDAAHYRLFRDRRVNDAVGRALAAVVGISMCSYRVLHRLHHNHLYESRDPDLPLHAGYPRGRGYLVRKLARDLTGRTAVKTYSYFFGAPAAATRAAAAGRPLDDTAPELRRAAMADRWMVVAVHVGLPVAAVAAGLGVEYLVLWVLPLLTVLQALLRLRAILEHGAVTDLASPLTAARTNTGPRWLLWLLFPHHVNHHVEHHLYPAVPHYALPACHAEMARHGLLDGAEVRDVRDTLAVVFAEPRPAAA